MKTRLSGRIAGIILAVLALASCQQPNETAKEANPDAKPGVTLSDGELVLPAVKGNPGAAYFAVRNAGSGETAIAAVSIEGAAKTEMHETTAEGMTMLASVPVKAGETVTFAPGGRHVMAFELADTLVADGTTELTLVFSDGDKLSAKIPVKGAGAMAGGHDGHGGSH